MEWQDEAVVLGTRRHGETSLIVELMTPARGRHLGLVRGGRSKRTLPALQPGNSVSATWRARLEEHLGQFTIEPVTMRTAELIASPIAVFAVQLIASHLRLLPERDPHVGLYRALLVILEHLDDGAITAELIVRFELALLEELGFGLDLTRCAGTGAQDNLIYVSPKTGRAVSAEAGQPYADKLLALPGFMASGADQAETEIDMLVDGFRLTGFFLARHVWDPRGLAPPSERESFLKALRRQRRQG
ncbi:MAG: DNA repair protein RecO [Pseudomonadota bacterium]